MSLSRQHYVAIAGILRETLEDAGGLNWRTAVHAVADRLADYFAADNPRFDRARFMLAAAPRGTE